MATPRIKRDGCWTCRLRRKKCDGTRPLCGGCSVLDIPCHYAAAKPRWMDGGAAQESMAESIKTQIKNSASGRRARQMAQGPERFVITSVDDYSADPGLAVPSRVGGESGPGPAPGSLSSPSAVSAARPAPTQADIDSTITGLAALRFPPLGEHDGVRPPASSPLSLVTVGPYGELALVMRYIDYVFPHLFPYHRSPVFSTGRSFLLVPLTENKVIYLSVLSISSYYFIVTMNEYTPHDHQECLSHAWTDIGFQMQASFKLIHKEMDEINRQSTEGSLKERRTAIQSIVQLMIFITAVGKPANWNLHLSAAISLFRDILNMTSSPSGPSMKNAMDDLAKHFPTSPWIQIKVWSPDQVAFRFFIGMLTFMDIIAATSLQRPPALEEYYSHLIMEGDDGVARDEHTAPIQFSLLVGCQNWVLVAIGQTSSLAVWKKEARKAGTFSQLELAARAEPIGIRLRQGHERLASSDSVELQLNTSITPTRIWAFAAQAYLLTVVSGWRLSSPDIRRLVAEGLGLIYSIQEPGALRSFSWPLCVLGCLVDTAAQEQEIRDLINGMGGLKDFGSLPENLRLMEVVWQSRNTLDPETWDVASCLTALGEPALLI